jgi:stringent starvation protein B
MTTVSTKPYLLRAIWEWCVDQGFTPYHRHPGGRTHPVPPGYARDGQIVLNLAPDATGQMQMANDFISFQARFGGAAHSLVIPVANVIAIYARENGQGMAFEPELEAVEGEAEVPRNRSPWRRPGHRRHHRRAAPRALREPQPPARPPRGSHLKIVK